MRNRLLQIVLLVGLFQSSSRCLAQTLPPPRVLPPERQPLPPMPMPMPMPMPPAAYRPSAYQVWQYYGRTYSGSFRPIVIDGPAGGYYRYRGIPFPWVRNYPGEYTMPLARD